MQIWSDVGLSSVLFCGKGGSTSDVTVAVTVCQVKWAPWQLFVMVALKFTCGLVVPRVVLRFVGLTLKPITVLLTIRRPSSHTNFLTGSVKFDQQCPLSKRPLRQCLGVKHICKRCRFGSTWGWAPFYSAERWFISGLQQSNSLKIMLHFLILFSLLLFSLCHFIFYYSLFIAFIFVKHTELYVYQIISMNIMWHSHRMGLFTTIEPNIFSFLALCLVLILALHVSFS